MEFIEEQEQEQENDEDASEAELWMQWQKEQSNENKLEKIEKQENEQIKQQQNINISKSTIELNNQQQQIQNLSDLSETQKETLKDYMKEIKESKLIAQHNKQLIQEDKQQHSNQQWEQVQQLENQWREEMKNPINQSSSPKQKNFQSSSSFPSEVQFKSSNNQSIEWMKQQASEQIVWGPQSRKESRSGSRFGQNKTEIMKFKDKQSQESFAEFKLRHQQMKKQQQQQSSSSQIIESSETKSESKTKKYTPYTFSDFKKIQSQSVKLGGLGPDLENVEVKKKKADREKVMEFADKQKKENFEKIQKLRIKQQQLDEERQNQKQQESNQKQNKPKNNNEQNQQSVENEDLFQTDPTSKFFNTQTIQINSPNIKQTSDISQSTSTSSSSAQSPTHYQLETINPPKDVNPYSILQSSAPIFPQIQKQNFEQQQNKQNNKEINFIRKSPLEEELEKKKMRQPSSREKALKFASNITKPKIQQQQKSSGNDKKEQSLTKNELNNINFNNKNSSLSEIGQKDPELAHLEKMLMSMEERHNNDQLNVAYAMKNQFSTSNTAHRISSKDNNGIVFSSTTTMNMNQHNGLKPVTPGAVPHRALTDADIIRNHEIAEQYAKLMTSDKKN